MPYILYIGALAKYFRPGFKFFKNSVYNQLNRLHYIEIRQFYNVSTVVHSDKLCPYPPAQYTDTSSSHDRRNDYKVPLAAQAEPPASMRDIRMSYEENDN